ncbi:protein farnesyltransferase [Rhizopus microsporus ATCC 52813]|uniref:Protein farnesyltransferase/geranylgeranyltransferase type-1 subunit alpha n=1 Tax=Rhizopus microsporus ATCC 52813 TaxID=1340429 RepID=A0A2G4SXS2_RHIZD|nr:protein farnesyltransferase [Rhizopus microsporus ATCC 52813]PHZ13557.1 protein farnesyltransferase [Rhizopus microsporus ATCC 52813]
MLYSENPDWKDITPIPQDDGPNPLVPIAYSTEYKDAMDYFRAVIHANEKSERVLQLTQDILERNPAHYTVWNYRQDVLFALNKDLDEELDYIDEIAADQAKNYQIWHHRQIIADRLNKGDRELNFINSILEDDPKNYHGWSYRQWVVKRFNLWEKELAYTSDLIMFDVRNNSAWNYRYYILFEKPTKPTEEEIKQEIEFCHKHIRLAPNNPSSWSYLKGIYEATRTPLDTIEPFLKELVDSLIESPYILSMYIDIYEKRAKDSKTQVDQAALDMCDILASKQDAIREKYWAYKKQKLMAIHA